MFKEINKTYYRMGAMFTLGMISSKEAKAGGNDFSKIAENVITSIQDLPALLSGLAYMFGLLLCVLGIMKIKDHVENPSQTPLKDGAIRLATGGAMFSLPIVYEAGALTTGDAGVAPEVAKLNKITFN